MDVAQRWPVERSAGALVEKALERPEAQWPDRNRGQTPSQGAVQAEWWKGGDLRARRKQHRDRLISQPSHRVFDGGR